MSEQEDRPEGYDPGDYPPFAVAVDLVLLTVRDGELETVLVRRDEDPFARRFALPGGFVRPEEDLDEAARRIFFDKTGVAVPYLEQLRTYGRPSRDPRMRVVSVAYLVLCGPEHLSAASRGLRSDEDVRVVPISALSVPGPDGRQLAFDHDEILADAVERARAKLEYTTLGTTFLPEEFSIPDLRRVYEAVWGVALHAGNFSRKVRGVEGFVVPVGRSTGRGRVQRFRRGGAALMVPPLMRPYGEPSAAPDPELGQAASRR